MARSLLITGFACFVVFATALPAPDAVDPDSLQCLSSLNAYETAYTSWFSEIVTETVTSSADGQWLSSEVPYTTLCDGRPRALAEKSRWVTSSVTFDPPQTMTRLQGRENTDLEYSTYPEPSPTCTIADSACKSFHSSYTASLSDYTTNNAPSPTASPLCTVYRPCSENSDYCFIHGGGAKLYYWPVTTTSGDFCAYNGSTIFAAPTNPLTPNTVVTDGHTFTSPTNYFSLRGAQAYIHSTRRRLFECGGASYSDVLVPLTETLSSFASATQTSVQESFNFENFNTVPASAWDAQRRCQNGRNCNEIGVDYTPLIPLPTEILNLEPKEWKAAGCKGTDYTGYQLEHVALVTPAPTATGRVRL